MPKVSVYRGRTHLFDHWIEKPEVILGRSADADVPLDSPVASRKHCRIVKKQGAYILEEIGAKNGLFVNGKYCNVHRLVDGDRIEIADLLVTFHRPRSEMRQQRGIDRNQPGAAYRITTAQVEDAISTRNKDSGQVRRSVAQEGHKHTTAVSPDALAQMMKEMEKKLQAHVEVVMADGKHERIGLSEASYLVGFDDSCEIKLGARIWPWGKLAAKITTMTDRSHKLSRLSKWVTIKVGGEKLEGVHILRDKDLVEIGGVTVRYLGRSEIAK
ncbi:MAG: FHA domain-containing protein [Proteobacteria bacterium]|nr:FHA domain-containing protein [Pseudomonadota bacterium]